MSSRHYAVAVAFFFLVAGLVLAPAGFSRADEDPPEGLGLARVTYITGDTLFNSSDTEEWAALSPNFALRAGDRLWSGEDSKLETRFSGGQAAWLNDQSELDIVRMDRDQSGNYTYQVALASGEASFATRGKNSVFQVDTPNTSVRAYGRAQFRVTTMSDGTSQVGVTKGSVEVETPDGATQVRSGEMVEVDAGGYTSFTNLPPRDPWDDWVASRWDRYSRPARSARYLPGDLGDYGQEFDEGGRWVSAPDYGNVWVPTVAVGWSPYSNGRWVWIAGDYVWLPYDPWYAPFHYGRWAFTASFGWFWVPPVAGVAYWSPGYVGWVWGPDHVCWVPLAPREVYYGYGYYGPYSVNVTKVNVVNVTNVYVNARVTNSVVVVNRNNFLSGNIKRVSVAPRDNPFVNRGALGTRLIARPPVQELKPVRETRIPRPQATVAPRQLPPPRLEKPAPFVKQRAIVRAPAQSAFRPGVKPPKLEQALQEKGKLRTPRGPVAPGGRQAVPETRGGRPGGTERGFAPGREQVQPGGRQVVPETRGGRPGGPERGFAPGREQVQPGGRPGAPERVAPGGQTTPETRGGRPGGPRGLRERVAPPAGGGQAAPEMGRAPRGRERAVPGRVTPEQAAPEGGVAPGRGREKTAPERVAPERGTPERVTPERVAPEGEVAPGRGRGRVAPERVAPEQAAPGQAVPERGRARVAPEERAIAPERPKAAAPVGGGAPEGGRAPQAGPKWKRAPQQPGAVAPGAAPGPGRPQRVAPPAQGEKKEKEKKKAPEGEEKPAGRP